MVSDFANEGDLIQLITEEDDSQQVSDNLKEEIPILSVRNTVLVSWGGHSDHSGKTALNQAGQKSTKRR
jgi:hypothetical protein